MKLFEIKIKRLIGWGDSVARNVESAGMEMQITLLDRVQAACLRKHGEGFEDKIVLREGKSSHSICSIEDDSEIIRCSKMTHNGFEDMQKRSEVRLLVQYWTWDGKQ